MNCDITLDKPYYDDKCMGDVGMLPVYNETRVLAMKDVNLFVLVLLGPYAPTAPTSLLLLACYTRWMPASYNCLLGMIWE